MLYWDVIAVFNANVGKKMTIRNVIFAIRNEIKSDGTTGIKVNDDNVSKYLRKMFLRGHILRETATDNHTLLYWIDEPMHVDDWEGI